MTSKRHQLRRQHGIVRVVTDSGKQFYVSRREREAMRRHLENRWGELLPHYTLTRLVQTIDTIEEGGVNGFLLRWRMGI